jgi:PTH1 family peptidyl-tRNA hydrolase
MQALFDLLRPQATPAIQEGAAALIVGLGNPGREYADTRHNAGFQVVSCLAERHALSFSRKQMDALIAAGRIANVRVVLAKPQTWMNESGRAVAPLMRFYKVERQRLLVIYDDLDLPVGVIRLRAEGGSGGHKGMKSIIEKLGGSDFPRLRVGIGRPPGKMDPVDYVLQPFGRDEMSPDAYTRAVDAIEVFIQDGLTVAMNKFNAIEKEKL